MHIKPGNTKLIDKGTIVAGIQYTGSAPDLGAFEYGVISSIAENKNVNSFQLHQNYPNPFNPETSIRFSIPTSENVELNVYNILGQKVSLLINEQKAQGEYEIKFNASNLPSGIYIYSLRAGNVFETRKMLLVK